MKNLSKQDMKLIIGGSISDESLAGCSKDCGNNVTITCSGSGCTTTEYGCYASQSDGSTEFQLC